jgi:purine/pyrimidine-nucleoside phosphorylase
MTAATQFENVSLVKRGNIFGARCVSHTVILADGTTKSLSVILPGSLKLPIVVNEMIEIQAGHCDVRLVGQSEWVEYRGGDSFRVAGNSCFDIDVLEAVDYVCHFED